MNRRLWSWVLLSLAAGAIALLGLRYGRGFPWLLATFSGLGVGALTFSTFQTIRRLRAQVESHRR